LKIFGEFTDFDQAVEEYKKILEMNQNYFVYLLVPANQVYRNIREVEETPRFLIGYFVPSDTIKNNYLVEKESLK
jgi:lipopolysaccharide biosynthesis regulator YciM